MKAEKAFTIIGKKLEKEYKRLGFKYLKKYKFLRKRTKNFDYYIFFSPFFKYIHPMPMQKLRVTLMINDRSLLKTNINAHCEIFRMDLWEMGNHYNIANETLLDDVFIDLRNKIKGYLLSQIKKLEGENR
jgi:hypothetical protein